MAAVSPRLELRARLRQFAADIEVGRPITGEQWRQAAEDIRAILQESDRAEVARLIPAGVNSTILEGLNHLLSASTKNEGAVDAAREWMISQTRPERESPAATKTIGHVEFRGRDRGVLFLPAELGQRLTAEGVQAAGADGIEIVLIQPDQLGDLTSWMRGYLAGRNR